MKPRLAPLLGAFAALTMAAGYVHAFSSAPQVSAATSVAADKEPPKDCKMNPDDKRCKDPKKY
ncbi:MAG: hypothetical protein ACREVQ_07615 [Burkholderiales bacterium]